MLVRWCFALGTSNLLSGNEFFRAAFPQGAKPTENRPRRHREPMPSLVLALLAGTCLALVFDSTRWLGVLGAAVLAVLYPVPFTIVATVVTVALLYFHHFRGDP